MNHWNLFPVFRLILPFILGIAIAIFYRQPLPYPEAVLCSLLSLIIISGTTKRFYLKYKYRWIFGFLINLILLFSGYNLVILKTEINHLDHFSKQPYHLALINITEPISEKQKTIRTTVEVTSVKNNTGWIKTNGKAIIYIKKDSLSRQIHYGDVLVTNIKFQEVNPPQNPSEFNYKRYLSFHSIYHQAYIPSDSWKTLNRDMGNPLFRFSYLLRKKLLTIFSNSNIKNEEYAVASALILGFKDELNPDLKKTYASAGAIHVLAVSGLHVGIIYWIMNSLLFFLKKFKHGDILRSIILILILWFYALLTGMSPSVMRAVTMFSFIIIGKSLNRNTNIYNILSSSAFLLLLINPFLIVEVGFQLSYLAVIGIVFIYPKLYQLWNTDNMPINPITWLLDKIWAITCVSIAAQLATFPLGLFYFHQFPNYFLFSNLIVIPAATAILYLGILVFVTFPIPLLSKVIAWLLGKTVFALNTSVKFIEQLPYSLTEGISISMPETWMIYGTLASLIAFLTIHKIKYLRWGLLILTGILSLQVFEKGKEASQKKLIIYNISGVSAYDFVDGKQNYLLADSTFLADKSKLLFHIKNNWWNLGINKIRNIQLPNITDFEERNLLVRNNFVQFHNKRIVLLNQKYNSYHQQEEKTKIDYLILADNIKCKISEILSVFDIGTIIIDSSNSSWKAKQWLEECKKLNVEGYSTRLSGAFQVEV